MNMISAETILKVLAPAVALLAVKMWNRRLEKKNRAKLSETSVERLTSELVSRPLDDGMFQNRDGTGPYYCNACYGERRTLPLTERAIPGTYSCGIRDQI
jgi:hypothetical protein